MHTTKKVRRGQFLERPTGGGGPKLATFAPEIRRAPACEISPAENRGADLPGSMSEPAPM